MRLHIKTAPQNAGHVQGTRPEMPEVTKMWAQLKKFSPFAFIAGYLALYYSGKGFDRILPDLTGITVEKLSTKTAQFMVIGGAVIGLYAVNHIKGIPTAIKTIGVVVLYFIIGYNLALAVDPPVVRYSAGSGGVAYVPPTRYNPYLNAGR